MKNGLMVFGCLFVIMVFAVASAQGDFVLDVSCDGTQSTGGGNRLYDYVLRNPTSDAQSIIWFVVGTDDGNEADYSNWIEPAGWSHIIRANSHGLVDNPHLKTPHGQIAPVFTGATAYEVYWWGNSITLDPNGGTREFAFDNYYPSENVQWKDSLGDAATWAQAVAGGVGVYTDGPVHAPVPEPSTFILFGAAAISLLAYAWRQRKQAS